MSPMGDVIFVVVEIVLILFFFLACSCTTWLRRREACENEQQGHHPRSAPVVAPPRRHQQYAPRNEERLRAPVVLAHFPYAARARAASEQPPACAICLDELRQGQLCSEVPACRHIFHEGCICVWAKNKNSCPLCRAKLVLPGAAYGVAPADDIV